jgi:pimeloyl-ACP methyl ester carboxylesterase
MRLRTKLAGAVALVLVAAVVVNAALARQDVARFQPPGALITVAGHKLHLFCEGAGAPTVILDAGLGGSSLYLRTIQRALKDSVRTCAYDRAGLGWSESGSGQLDVASSANELRELLRASKTPLPAVLVGHSLGANIAEYYAATFGADLAGAVLIDPGTTEDLLEDFDGTEAKAMAITGCGWKCTAAAAAANLGVVRLATRKAGAKHMSREDAAAYRAEIARSRTQRTVVGALEFLPKTAFELRRMTSFGSVPITVIYSEKTRGPEGKETVADVDAWHALTLDRMRALLRLTSHGRGPIIAPGVTHSTIVLDSAGVSTIVEETLRLVRAANPSS